MARTRQEHQETLSPAEIGQHETAQAVVEYAGVSDLFKRQINSTTPVHSLRLKRVLTRPLVSMAKRKELVIEAQSEMYTMDLPLTGRGGGISKIRVIDAIDATDEQECTVICHELMVSALKRAGYRTLGYSEDDKKVASYPEQPGDQLKGAKFAFLAGDVADGKRYRQISVAELE